MTAVEVPTARRVRNVVEHSLRPTTRPSSEIVSLASGEPDFGTPEHIQGALIDALHSGLTHYAAWSGDPELRDALAAHLSQPGREPWSANEILVTHGGSGALSAAFLACVGDRDRVVIPSPTYSLYADLVRLAGGEPHFVPQDEAFRLDIDAIAAAAPGARMIVLCNPCNPTGAAYAARDLEQIALIAEQHDLLVVCDEAYDQIVYDPLRFTSSLDVPELRRRLVYVQTFSKTYAMTGWRVGYLAAPVEFIASAAVVHRSMAGPMNTAVQRAALAAITGGQDAVVRMRTEYEHRRAIVCDLLGVLTGAEIRPPDGTFYFFVQHPRTLRSLEVVRRAREAGVAVRPGSEFGPQGEGYVRLSFATDRETLRRGVAILTDVLSKLSAEAAESLT